MKHIEILCVPFLILIIYLSWTILFLFNPSFYAYLQQRSSIQEHPLNTPIILYFASPSFDLPHIPLLTPEENSHLLDVKYVIFTAELLLAILAFFLFLSRTHLTFHTLRTTGIVLIILPFFFFIIPFELVFTQFHYLAFPQGNWQFNPETTTLVNMYPEIFFQHFIQTIILFTLLTGILFLILARKIPIKN